MSEAGYPQEHEPQQETYANGGGDSYRQTQPLQEAHTTNGYGPNGYGQTQPPSQRMSFVATLGKKGVSTTTYPFGPDFGDVPPWKPAEGSPLSPKKTTPWDPPTMRRKKHDEPPSPVSSKTLRYPHSASVPFPTEPYPDKLNFMVKLLGAGVDGTMVPVRVKSTGTVADVITTAVHNLHAMSGPPVSYANLRVTGLFSESGRPLAPGYRLNSQHQVPFIKDGAMLTLKVFY